MRAYHIARIVILMCVFFQMCTNGAPHNQTKSPIPGAIPSAEWNWGIPVEGICGEAGVIWDKGRDKLPIISVKVVDTNVDGFYGEAMPEDEHETLPILKKMFSDTFLYFAPTNLFCGAIELRDTRGKKLPLLKPNLCLPEFYPESFNIVTARNNNPHPPTSFPTPLVSWQDSLAQFRLSDFFDIKEPGEYELTVWPKIYKRSSPTNNLCSRIDLAPVTVTIKWNGELSSSK